MVDHSVVGPIVFFSYAALCAVSLWFAGKYLVRRFEHISFILPAVLCVLVGLECVAIALSFRQTGRFERHLLYVRVLLHAIIAPIFVVETFELAYLVHKRRSVNFFGIKFDAGHRLQENQCSNVIRHCMWISSLFLAALTVGAAIHFIASSDALDDAEFRYATEHFDFRRLDTSVQALADAVPFLYLSALTVYIGAMTWRYGTFYSFRVHATYCNPWAWLFLGALFMCAGRLMPSSASLYTSNAGELLYLITLVRLLPEVHKDLEGQSNMARFLGIPVPVRRGRSGDASDSVDMADVGVVEVEEVELGGSVSRASPRASRGKASSGRGVGLVDVLDWDKAPGGTAADAVVPMRDNPMHRAGAPSTPASQPRARVGSGGAHSASPVRSPVR